MPRRPQDVTDAELDVLQSLWEHGPSTTRQLAERLYPTRRSPPAATVLKLLERLEGKGFVRRDASGAVTVFEAIVARDDLIERRLEAVAESLCDGSVAPLLMHLVDPKRLKKEEIDMLTKLVEDLNRDAKNRGKDR